MEIDMDDSGKCYELRIFMFSICGIFKILKYLNFDLYLRCTQFFLFNFVSEFLDVTSSYQKTF